MLTLPTKRTVSDGEPINLQIKYILHSVSNNKKQSHPYFNWIGYKNLTLPRHSERSRFCRLTCTVWQCICMLWKTRFLNQRSALPGYLGKGITSLIFSMPVAKRIIRSKPSPNPLCLTVPKRRRSRYHSYGSSGNPDSVILQKQAGNKRIRMISTDLDYPSTKYHLYSENKLRGKKPISFNLSKMLIIHNFGNIQ